MNIKHMKTATTKMLNIIKNNSNKILRPILMGLLILGIFTLSITLLETYTAYNKFKTNDSINKEELFRAFLIGEYYPNTTRYYEFETPEKEKKKIKVSTDNDGFIMPSKIHTEPDINIVFLGSSTTSEITIEEDKRFPYLAGRLLERDLGLKVNSYNGGRDGVNSWYSINTLLSKVIPYKPEAVILMNNIRDIGALTFRNDTEYEKYWRNYLESFHITTGEYLPNFTSSQFTGACEFLPHICTEYLIDTKSLALGTIVKPQEQETPVDINLAKDLYRKSLKTFIAICKTWDIKPVLMTEPYFAGNTELPYYPIGGTIVDFDKKGVRSFVETLHLEFNDIAREVAKEENVLLIDLAKEIPNDKEEYFYDFIHHTPEGAEKISEIAAKRLKTILVEN